MFYYWNWVGHYWVVSSAALHIPILMVSFPRIHYQNLHHSIISLSILYPLVEMKWPACGSPRRFCFTSLSFAEGRLIKNSALAGYSILSFPNAVFSFS